MPLGVVSSRVVNRLTSNRLLSETSLALLLIIQLRLPVQQTTLLLASGRSLGPRLYVSHVLARYRSTPHCERPASVRRCNNM